MKQTIISALAVIGVSFFAVHCGSNSSDCLDTRTCPDGTTDGGPNVDGGDGGTVQPPAGCDPALDPKDAPKCVVSEFGVFVDGTAGNDGNAGTREAPVKTIGAAVTKAGAKPRIYVCEGTYAESVKLTSALSMFGGFACGGSWSHAGGKSTVTALAAGQYALEVAGVAGALSLQDLSLNAAAGTADAVSSIAVFVKASADATFKRCELKAAAGFNGKQPPKAASGALMSSTPTASTLDGNAANVNVGGFAQLCTCVGGGTSKGGGGGNANSGGEPGETAQAAIDPPGATGQGSTVAECVGGQNGRSGSNAPNAAPGGGATKLGTLTESGWVPQVGANGTAGGAGQGGGGGGGSGGGGGGGACGGCGGSGGSGGAGGGASVALLALNSPAKLVQSVLTTAAAGAGGAGGDGGDGLAGGVRGTGGGAACNGGNGGKGGNGGGGGGGAGGVSVGVLYKGPKPTIDAVTTTGAKGAAGVGPAGNNGVEGQKADTLEVQ